MESVDSMRRGDLNIDDPFDAAFPVAIEAAKRCCADRDVPNGQCFAYHSLWPRLRRIGCTGSAWLHAESYVNTFRWLAASNHSRILVSGTADYTLIAFLIHAYRAEGVEPDVTVLDLCGTPLAISRWYAERHDCSIRTVTGNLLDFEDNVGFDVITTDNLLARFDEAQRGQVFSQWRRLLRSGGTAVTAQRVTAQSLTEDGWNGGEVHQKLDRIRKHATENSKLLDVSVEDLLCDARRYYEARIHIPIQSVVEITRLFADNGFEIEAALDPPPHNPGCPRTGRLSRSTRYTMFVARTCGTPRSHRNPTPDLQPTVH